MSDLKQGVFFIKKTIHHPPVKITQRKTLRVAFLFRLVLNKLTRAPDSPTWAPSQYKTVFHSMKIPIIKMRLSWDSLFIMGIPILLVKRYHYIETAHWLHQVTGKFLKKLENKLIHICVCLCFVGWYTYVCIFMLLHWHVHNICNQWKILSYIFGSEYMIYVQFLIISLMILIHGIFHILIHSAINYDLSVTAYTKDTYIQQLTQLTNPRMHIFFIP